MLTEIQMLLKCYKKRKKKSNSADISFLGGIQQNMTSNGKYQANRIFFRRTAASFFSFYLLIWMDDLFIYFLQFLIFKN